jgi:osmotically-inducible protein OsmY
MRCVTPYSGTGEYIDDTAITTKVKAELLNDLSINVETFKGEVQLSGFANFNLERERAEALASSCKGLERRSSLRITGRRRDLPS